MENEYGLPGEGLVWLIGVVVCRLDANRGSNCSLRRPMDGRIQRCGIISSCQSAATAEIVKRYSKCWTSSLPSPLTDTRRRFKTLRQWVAVFDRPLHNSKRGICGRPRFSLKDFKIQMLYFLKKIFRQATIYEVGANYCLTARIPLLTPVTSFAHAHWNSTKVLIKSTAKIHI